MTLLRRVAALERFAREVRTGPCAECRGDGPVAIEFDAERDRPERCAACGRRLVWRLQFDKAG